MARRGGRHPPDVGVLHLHDRALTQTEAVIDIVFDTLLATRWVHFASIAIVFGGAVFALGVGPAQGRRQRVAAVVAGLSGLAWLAGTIAYATGGFASLLDPAMLQVFFVETPFGPPAIVRLVLLSALLGLAAWPTRVRRRAWADLVAGGALLVSQAWLGHAAEGGATPIGAAMIACYGVHLLAGSAWIGGLPALAASLRRPDAIRTVDRFATLGIVAVALVVLSGVANALFHVHDVGALAESAYGRILCVKVALVTAMIALATINRFAIMPRLRGGASDARGQLRRGIVAELMLAMLVLGAAALLGITPPPG